MTAGEGQPDRELDVGNCAEARLSVPFDDRGCRWRIRRKATERHVIHSSWFHCSKRDGRSPAEASARDWTVGTNRPPSHI